jgi:uncharacterized protein YdhG (YjbR/CyaY superfamily)
MRRSTSTPRGSAAVARKRAAATDIDDYLARVPEPARTTLEKLRKTIKAAAPEATETISYQLPTFRHLGVLVGFGAAASHCALYLMSGTALAPFEGALSAYDTSKGTVRFPADAPLPAALVKKLVAARIAENEARAAGRGRGARGAMASRAKAGMAKRGGAKAGGGARPRGRTPRRGARRVQS